MAYLRVAVVAAAAAASMPSHGAAVNGAAWTLMPLLQDPVGRVAYLAFALVGLFSEGIGKGTYFAQCQTGIPPVGCMWLWAGAAGGLPVAAPATASAW